MGLWRQSASNSSRIINGIDNGKIIFFEHCIQFFDKVIMENLEKKYNKQFLATFSYKDQKKEKEKEKDIICSSCIFNNFLIYKMGYIDLPIPKNHCTILHTNGYNKNKVTQSQKDDLLKRLNASRDTYILNAQGDGISDEYPDCPVVHDIFYSFLENEFPNKTEFENSYKRVNLLLGNNIEHFGGVFGKGSDEKIKELNELSSIVVCIVLLLVVIYFIKKN